MDEVRLERLPVGGVARLPQQIQTGFKLFKTNRVRRAGGGLGFDALVKQRGDEFVDFQILKRDRDRVQGDFALAIFQMEHDASVAGGAHRLKPCCHPKGAYKAQKHAPYLFHHFSFLLETSCAMSATSMPRHKKILGHGMA